MAARRRADDRSLFGPEALPRLREAVRELSWLLSRGYAARSALDLVGNRHALLARQRLAVARSACADEARRRRRRHELERASELLVDGHNVLTTVQVARQGGLVLRGRDGCCRDLLGAHGRRPAAGWQEAIECVGRTADNLGVRACTWYLDRPVAHSGRVAAALRRAAAAHGWDWNVEIVPSPDGVLARAAAPVATSDGPVLDRCAAWLNLTRFVIAAAAPHAFLVDLDPDRDDDTVS